MTRITPIHVNFDEAAEAVLNSQPGLAARRDDLKQGVVSAASRMDVFSTNEVEKGKVHAELGIRILDALKKTEISPSAQFRALAQLILDSAQGDAVDPQAHAVAGGSLTLDSFGNQAAQVRKMGGYFINAVYGRALRDAITLE